MKTDEKIGLLLGGISTLATLSYVITVIRAQSSQEYSVGVIVQDESGNLIVGATIQIGIVTLESGEAGTANFVLQGGQYLVEITAAGFSPVSETINVNGNVILQVTLRP